MPALELHPLDWSRRSPKPSQGVATSMPAKWIKLDLGCELLFSVAYFQQKDRFLYTLCGMCHEDLLRMSVVDQPKNKGIG